MPHPHRSTEDAYNLEDLLYLMRRLRKPETGCPWDLKQNWQSITPSTIEEAYETVAAIESGDRQKICEELGDLLFQVVFYSQLGEEEGVFNFHAVVDGITRKLVQRHPHVFPNAELRAERDPNEDVEEDKVNANWEAIKKQERKQRGEAGLLDDVPQHLPALSRAEKLQKRASRVGLDWTNSLQVLEKLEEEIAEFKAELVKPEQNPQALQHELGDLFFTLVNLARFTRSDSSQALREANNRFSARVQWVEREMHRADKTMEDASAEELDAYWQAAKARGL